MKVSLNLKVADSIRCPLTRSIAVLYASVSASFIIEQEGLPSMESDGRSWNGNSPQRRLSDLRKRSSL